jgi:hypothetical protein
MIEIIDSLNLLRRLWSFPASGCGTWRTGRSRRIRALEDVLTPDYLYFPSSRSQEQSANHFDNKEDIVCL